MSEHTREIVGQLARWALLVLLGVLGLAAGLLVLTAMPHTLRAARGRVLALDALRPAGQWVVGPVYTEPSPRYGQPILLGRVADGTLRRPFVTTSGQLLVMLARPGAAPGEYAYSPVANPYAGYPPTEQDRLVRSLAPGDRVLLVDWSVLPPPRAGRSANGDPAWRALAQLNRAGVIAYLVDAPLESYQPVRRHLLSHGPRGPVLPANPYWARPASDAQRLQAARQAAAYSRGVVLLVTNRLELARQAGQAGIPTLLLAQPGTPAPPGPVEIWPDLPTVARALQARPDFAPE